MGSGADNMTAEEMADQIRAAVDRQWPKQIRGEILDEAKGYIMKDRNSSYDEPERNFERIAMLWEAYLRGKGTGHQIEPHDVAIMMALMKIGRLEFNPANRDSWVDAIGYLACGAEVAGV